MTAVCVKHVLCQNNSDRNHFKFGEKITTVSIWQKRILKFLETNLSEWCYFHFQVKEVPSYEIESCQ